MAEKQHCCNPAACSPTRDANGLDEGQDTLKEEDEEEGHEVERAVSPESFVEWSEPAGVTTGAEEDEPKQGKAKVCGTSTPGPPSNTSDQIYAQCS